MIVAQELNISEEFQNIVLVFLKLLPKSSGSDSPISPSNHQHLQSYNHTLERLPSAIHWPHCFVLFCFLSWLR